MASLLLLGISTLIAIALVIHSELVPKKLLHVNNKSTNATNSTTLQSTAAATMGRETSAGGGGGGSSNLMVTTGTLTKTHQQQQQQQKQEQELENTPTTLLQTSLEAKTSTGGDSTLRRQSTTTLTASSTTTLKPPLRFSQTNSSTAGVRGAIGISWLLPLLFAITSPLICTINGKWPQHWWLEIMSHSLATTATTTSAMAAGNRAFSLNTATNSFVPLNERFIRTHLTPFTTEPPLLSNGDSVLEFNTTLAIDNGNGNGHANVNGHLTTTATSTGSSDSTSTIWSHTARSPVTSISFQHNNEDIYGLGTTTTSYSSVSLADAANANGAFVPPAVPALNFILFLCVDILFILLFFALFAILIKKLLWLWHKNRRTNNATAMSTTATTGITSSSLSLASTVATNTNTLQHQHQQQHHHHYQQQQSYNGNNAALDKFNMVMRQR